LEDLFKNEENKGNYALLYLKGFALDCFEPTLLDPTPYGFQTLNSSLRNLKPTSELSIPKEKLKLNSNNSICKKITKL